MAVRGLPWASLVTERVALRKPLAEGVKVTATVHEALGGKTLANPLQLLLLTMKSAAFAPATAILEMVTLTDPVFAIVMGEKVLTGAATPTVEAPKL